MEEKIKELENRIEDLERRLRSLEGRIVRHTHKRPILSPTPLRAIGKLLPKKGEVLIPEVEV